MQKGLDYPGVSIVYLCHDGRGNFLLNKRSANCRDEHGRWDPGGGGLELHDEVLERLQTEIQEEYCTKVLSHQFLGYRDVHRVHDERKTHWIALDFLVEVDRSLVRNGEPHKFDDIGWFHLDALPKPLHSQFPYFLEKYKNTILESVQ